MKLGVIACLFASLGVADATPLEIVQTANEDFEAQFVAGKLRTNQLALYIDERRMVTPWWIADASPYAEAASIVVLVQGTEWWMGNDDELDHSLASVPGVLHELSASLDRFDFAIPRNGIRWMGVYSDRVRWLPRDRIDGRILGTQRDYTGHTETALTAAITIGLEPATLRPAGRRIMIVIGNGCDRATVAERNHLRDELSRERIELHAIIYSDRATCNGFPITQLTSNIEWASSGEGIATALHDILDRANDQTFARFDAARLPWDGEVHRYEVIAGGTTYGPVFLALPDRRTPWVGWWLLGAAGAALALITLVLVIRRCQRSTAVILR